MLEQDDVTDDEYKYLYLINNTDNKYAFEELNTGDEIEITYVVMEEIDDKMTTEVFEYQKTGEQTLSFLL